MDHSPGFLKLVNEERLFAKEISLEEARRRLAANPNCVLLDVREDTEWAKGHVTGATHLGKGVFERDLEKLYPNPDTEILMYCGGGFRSVLTASTARRMGYWNCCSLIGGYRAMVQAKWTTESVARG
jgi:rhodanese-related sulfurtransferase